MFNASNKGVVILYLQRRKCLCVLEYKNQEERQCEVTGEEEGEQGEKHLPDIPEVIKFYETELQGQDKSIDKCNDNELPVIYFQPGYVKIHKDGDYESKKRENNVG